MRDLRRNIQCKPLEDEHFRELCEICGEIFNSKQSLVDHAKLHEKANQKREELPTQLCESCGQVFSSVLDLENHIKVIHSESKTLKTSRFRPTMQEPRKFSKDKKKRKFQCNGCNKIFNSRQGLQYHTKATHDKIKRKFPCGDCTLVFKSRQGMKYHKQVVHDKLKYPCVKCSKTFTRKLTFTNHRCES